ncbi:MAG: hypothetical protein F2780_07775 [Actinobacteria bacterium]|uniref:Unannotated protein n=1 Tax=freshwater metagenome TaxID=449393 RepID=A0A6J7EBI3_9ZZZZ|nr:hypothetical protein [Actinomycetota bacterium]
MANARAKAKKKRRKKKGTKARGPAIFLILMFVAAGVLLIAQIQKSPGSETTPIGIDSTTIAPGVDLSTAPINTDASSTSGTDPSNLGNPVTVHSDTLGDLDVDQVIDDWTGVDSPQLPDTISQVDASTVENSYINGNLPDGFYVGYLVSVNDETEQGFTFDIRSSTDETIPVTSGQQLYPAYVSSLIYVSLRTTSDANTAISAAKYFELAQSNIAEFVIPKTDLSALVTGTYMLLTVIDGTVIAAEGINAN